MRPISDIERRQQEILMPPSARRRRRNLHQFAGASDYIVVYQVEPGWRVRVSYISVLFKSPDELTDEEIVQLIGDEQ
jgi:hypothetical protein